MRRVPLDGGGAGGKLGIAEHLDHGHFAAGEGAGLVEGDDIDARRFSKRSGPVTTMPRRSAASIAAAVVRGMASPKVHGQVTMSVASAASRALSVPAPVSWKTMPTSSASASTPGTRRRERRSTRACSPLLALCVFQRMRARLAMRLSTCGPVSISRLPSSRRLPPSTRSPSPRATGKGSPVISDSSTAPRPATTLPSTGMASPCRTKTRSCGRTWSSGQSRYWPPRSTACGAQARRMALSDSVARARTERSRKRPMVMIMTSVPATSK